MPPPPEIPGMICVGLKCKVNTYPKRGRILCWILWKTPIRYVMDLFRRENPYRAVVAIYAPAPVKTKTEPESVAPAETQEEKKG